MSDKEFKALKVSLIVNFDPATKKSQSMKIQNFQEMSFDSINDQLFKLAAKSLYPRFNEVSIKYQILAANTAFVGVIKQKNKSSEEMERVEMPTISRKAPVPKPVKQMSYRSRQYKFAAQDAQL